MKHSEYQYEPLVTPDSWQGGARRFAVRLTQLMDTIFQRMGAMDRRLRALENAQKEEHE